MDKQTLKSGMLLKISVGSGKYGPKGKWSSIIRVISINRAGKEGVVTGMQYQTVATKGGEHHPADHFKFNPSGAITPIFRDFDNWIVVFSAKILV